MTRDEAKIVLLEDALRQAQHTVEFMHGCLTEPERYSYMYPDMTLREVERWAKLAPPFKFCVHSKMRTQDCEACEHHYQQMLIRSEACDVLGLES